MSWRRAATPEELAERFGFNTGPMNPRGNTQVQACLRAEQIIMRAWRNLALADVVLTGVPAMRLRADAEADEFHRQAAYDARARAEGDAPVLYYDTCDGDANYDPNAIYEQGALRIWTVGTNHVDIVRDRWHDSPTRRPSTVSYAAGHLAHKLDTLDHFRCERYGCAGGCGLECNVSVSPDCGGATRLLPVDRGSLVLLFRCCWSCEAALNAALPAPRRGGSPAA
jgi:hypothetical protein